VTPEPQVTPEPTEPTHPAEPNEPNHPNDRVYLHEYIDIIGQQRARYMHHMTAWWCPEARKERSQLCYGVWAVLGSTGHWPQVVNLWEYVGGWDALADSFAFEVKGPGIQDPMLQEWWHQAAKLRRGGDDRLLVPAPWTRPIEGLIADGVSGVTYAHELCTVPPGRSPQLLDLVREQGRAAVESLGVELVGAFNVALRNDTEAILLWAFPDWPTWSAFEQAWLGGGPGGSGGTAGSGGSTGPDGPLRAWRKSLIELEAQVERILLIDSPLSPMRIGRQPEVEDRRPLSDFFPPLED
jgi:hypothetical protein